MAQVEYSYIGKGPVYIRRRGVTTAPRARMGNCPKLSLKVDEEKKEQKDYTSLGGGNLDSLDRIKSVGLEMETSNLSPENLAIGLRGQITELLSVTAISDEVVAVVPGGLAQTARLPDMTQPMVVTNSAGTTTYADGTDYERTVSGFVVIESGTIVAGDAKVDYTPIVENVVEALVNSGYEYELVFEGMNEAKSGAPAVLDVFRIKFSPSGCDLIGDDFGSLKLTAEVLSDPTKTGTGLSKFLKNRMGKVS